MALKTPLPVRFGDVFPYGAYVVSVDPLNDFDKARAGVADPQMRDEETGERMWALRLLDADPEARAGQLEVKVKIPAAVQPVPPTAAIEGLPFRPVELEGLTVAPWVDTRSTMPRVAYSLRCTGMKAPSSSSGSSGVAGKVERSGS